MNGGGGKSPLYPPQFAAAKLGIASVIVLQAPFLLLSRVEHDVFTPFLRYCQSLVRLQIKDPKFWTLPCLEVHIGCNIAY